MIAERWYDDSKERRGILSMAIFGLDSLIKRVDWVKVGNWALAKLPTGIKASLAAYGIYEGGKIIKHGIDRHYASVDHAVDKAVESEAYAHVSHDGDFTFDARKRSRAPERVEGEFVDDPEALPETI